jgi:hypothetical protein
LSRSRSGHSKHQYGSRRTAREPANPRRPGNYQHRPDPGCVARGTKTGRRRTATGVEPGCRTIPCRGLGKAIAAGLTKSTHETGEWIATNAGHRGADNGRLFPVSHEQAQCTNRCCGSRNSLAAPGNRSHRPTIRNGIGQRQCRHLFKSHGGNARDSHRPRRRRYWRNQWLGLIARDREFVDRSDR